MISGHVTISADGEPGGALGTVRPPTPPADGPSLHQAAQAAIRRYILERRLRAGDPLPAEGRLAVDLGISRTSVREAVKALESVGILEARARVGLFVRAFSLDPILDNLGYGLLADRTSVRELLQVREHLEASFIPLVVRSVTPQQRRVLRSVVDRMGERAARGEVFSEEDRFFHRALYERVGNGLLLKLIDVFWVVFRRLREEALVEEEDDPVRAWEDHRRIVEALERGDAAGAQEAVLRHFVHLDARVQRAAPAGGGAAPAN
jgi:DNA-binding FadR family transcriptional regulator